MQESYVIRRIENTRGHVSGQTGLTAAGPIVDDQRTIQTFAHI